MTGPWIPKTTYEAYLEHLDEYKAAKIRYEESISTLLKDASVQLRGIEGRHKEPLSLYTKQRLKGYANPWSECADLIGLRLIVPLARDKQRVIDVLNEADGIEVVEIDFKEENRDPRSLKYGGLHLQVELADIGGPLGAPITCEVQVRTIAEHTWAETEHEYIYKGPDGIPPATRRIFARLLALIELVDDELNRGVENVSQLDSFSKHHLLKFLRKAYEEFATVVPSASLSAHHVHALLEAGEYDAAELEVLVTAFILKNHADIADLINDHGPDSPQFDVDQHVLIAQPELLLVLALLDSNAFQLANALRETDLYEVVKPVALWRGIAEFVAD